MERNCPMCHKQIIHKGKYGKANCSRAKKNGVLCHSCGQNKKPNRYWLGKKRDNETKIKISNKQKERNITDITKKKMSDGQKISWKNPLNRKKYIDALSKTKWIKVRTDKGQLEFLEKWNRLGFNFEPNYQIHRDDFLYYIDGYDKEKNVILEYDSKYHKRQKEKDVTRQQKIIDILNPKRFWRYNILTNKCINILESISG